MNRTPKTIFYTGIPKTGETQTLLTPMEKKILKRL